jgi:hypothetical protein
MAAQTWFVVRGGKEEGPFTGTQLKDMASSGKLKPNDQVRRGDVETARPASQIKGLFPTAGSAAVPSSPAQPPDQPQTATPKRKWLVIGSVVAAVLFLSCGGLFVLGLLVTNSERQAAKKDYAEADALWTSGKKGEAAAKYRSALKGLRGEEWATAYGRLIDFECEAGNTEAAKSLAADAAKAKVTPTVSHPEAKALVASGQASGQQQPKEATPPPATGDVLTADFYPFTSGSNRQTLGRLFFKDNVSVQYRKDYAYQPGGVIQVRWLSMTGPMGQALPPSKPYKLQHRLKDGFVEVGEQNEGLKQTVWHPVVKVGAKAGDGWEREVVPGIKESYKLTGFGVPKRGNKEIDFDGAGKKGKVLAALIEVRIVTDLGGGKSLVTTEEYELGQGVGPVSRSAFDGEGAGRKMNWSEFLTRPVKN